MLCSNILKGIRYTVVDIDAEDVLIPWPLVFGILLCISHKKISTKCRQTFYLWVINLKLKDLSFDDFRGSPYFIAIPGTHRPSGTGGATAFERLQRWRVWFVALKTGQRSPCAKCHVAEATSSRYKASPTTFVVIYDVDMLLSCAEMCQDTGPFCFCLLLILRPWSFLLPFLLDLSGIQNKLTRCNNDFWGVASGCLFIYIHIQTWTWFLRDFDPGSTVHQTSWFLYSC